MSSRINAAKVIGGALVAFGLAALVASLQISRDMEGSLGARVFPLFGALSLVLLGAAEFLNGARGRSATFEKGAAGEVIVLFLMAIAYVWAISMFGYLIATAGAAVLGLWMFGIRSPIGLLVAAVLCPAIYHLIFFELLGVFPPYGEWFDLLDVIQGA